MRTPRLPLAARYGPRLPRPTARLRLTILYGTLFLVCAAALACTTYLLVANVAKPELPLLGHKSGVVPGTHIRRAQSSNEAATFDLEELLVDSGIALGIVSVAAFALAWLAAGRILRPLATITATAQRVSAASLHERLRLPGPDDELKQLGDTLDGLFDRLEASFEAQRHFVANASHELRTPISRERAILQVALDDPDTPAGEWRRTSREVLASNAEQERLIEALLTLASSEGGLEHREPVDLSAVTEEVLLAPRPGTGRLGLHVEVIARPAFLHGNAVLTGRLVANLIDNAVRHNIPDGCVRITTGTSRGHAILSVSSTGPVIPPEPGRPAIPALPATAFPPRPQQPRPRPVHRPGHSHCAWRYHHRAGSAWRRPGRHGYVSCAVRPAHRHRQAAADPPEPYRTGRQRTRHTRCLKHPPPASLHGYPAWSAPDTSRGTGGTAAGEGVPAAATASAPVI